MCKARSEGGQRCFGHARDAFVNATAAVDRLWDAEAPRAEIREAESQAHRAEVDLASTEKGRAFLVDHAAYTRDYDRDRLLNSVERGMVLADMYAKNAALAEQTAQEREGAKARVADRAHSIAATLKRAAKVGWTGPVLAGVPVGYTIANPSFESGVATGLVLAGSAVFAHHQNKQTAPADKRSTADRAVYERVKDYQGRPPLFLTQRAVAEIEKHLSTVDNGAAAVRIRDLVLAQAQRRHPTLTFTRAA